MTWSQIKSSTRPVVVLAVVNKSTNETPTPLKLHHAEPLVPMEAVQPSQHLSQTSEGGDALVLIPLGERRRLHTLRTRLVSVQRQLIGQIVLGKIRRKFFTLGIFTIQQHCEVTTQRSSAGTGGSESKA